MHFDDLIQKTANESGHSTEQVSVVVDSLVKTLQAALVADEAVTLAKLGNFSVCTRAARTKRDPKSKELIDIPACKTVKFTLSNSLKDALNRGL